MNMQRCSPRRNLIFFLLPNMDPTTLSRSSPKKNNIIKISAIAIAIDIACPNGCHQVICAKKFQLDSKKAYIGHLKQGTEFRRKQSFSIECKFHKRSSGPSHTPHVKVFQTATWKTL